MMQAAVYGRLGQEPRAIGTKSGKPMTVASMAVELECRGTDEPVTQWVGVVAFGRCAEDLLRHDKGELVSVSGRVQVNRWAGSDGEEREQLQVVADSIVSARTVRPAGRSKATQVPNEEVPGELPF